MLQPFRSLLCCPPSKNRPKILLAASGPIIYTFNCQNGLLLSTWPSEEFKGKPRDLEERTASPENSDLGDAERSAKRRKTSLSREASSSASAEILVEAVNGRQSDTAMEVSNSDVSKMICTSNGEYVVAVTGEDKAIRVLHLLSDGGLVQISERHAFP